MKAATLPASELPAAPARARVASIVAVYTAVFFVGLPALVRALGAQLDGALALAPLGGAAWPAVGAIVGVLGAALMLASMARLRWPGGGWPISHLPPTRFVAIGAYRFARHPIYVGFTLALAGLGLAERSPGRGVLAPLALTLGWMVYAGAFEEPRLRERFGATYDEYAARTPLLPLPFHGALAALGRRAWLALRAPIERLANRTVLFRAADTVWVTYGALVALGGVTAAAVNAPLLAGWGLSARAIVAYHLGLTASMLLGGRLVWLAYQWRLVARAPRTIWRRVGFVSFGGYLGLFAWSALFARAAGLDLLGFFDRALPAGILISAFGRLGCLSYGCCYGRPCALGVRWTAPAAKVNRERGDEGRRARVPTPLFSALLALGVSTLGLALLARGAAPGAATASVLFVYGTARCGLEHWRDETRLTRARATLGQLLCLPLAAGGLTLWLALPAAAADAARVDVSVLATTWPTLPLVFALAFAVCGYHRREVGAW
jgi:prolipoprotein diacylglyceryltransferase/protein-S-isoprenylcysteine O-methyltransferase Ste14